MKWGFTTNKVSMFRCICSLTRLWSFGSKGDVIKNLYISANMTAYMVFYIATLISTEIIKYCNLRLLEDNGQQIMEKMIIHV